MAYEADDYRGASKSTGVGAAAAALRAAAIQTARTQASARRTAQRITARPGPMPVSRSIRVTDDIRENRPQFNQPSIPLNGLGGNTRTEFDRHLSGLMRSPDVDPNQTGVVSVRDDVTGWRTVLPREDAPVLAQGAAALARGKDEIDRFVGMTGEQRSQVRENLRTHGGKRNDTIKRMIEDVEKDPVKDPEKLAAIRSIASQIKDETQLRYLTDDDLMDNPLLRVMNDMSVWSQYRRKVADWQSANRKTSGGEVSPGDDGGDGTYTGVTDGESFSSATSPSNLAPYIVSRDQSGALTVVSVDQWLQGKFTDMRKNPAYAGQVITALALMSDYGTDSSANSQASRVVTDKDGNVVKALVDTEDLAALKRFANKVAIWQNNGDESAIEDVLEEMTQLGAEVSAMNGANGEHGGSGGGGGYYRGGGGGYGGGGGGAAQTRYTDGAELRSLLDSIGRQRIGRSMTAEEGAAFVAYYHQLEEQTSAAYAAGQSYTMLSAEAQAIDWITSRFGGEASKQAAGNLAVDFMKLMASDNPFGSM